MDYSPTRYRRDSDSYDSDSGHSTTSFRIKRSVSRSKDESKPYKHNDPHRSKRKNQAIEHTIIWKIGLSIATIEAVIIPITLFLENRPERITLKKVAILGTKTNPTLKAVLQIDRLTAEVALKCLGTEETIRSPVVQNISLLVVREMQKRTTIQELKRSRNIDHTKTHLGLIAVEAKVTITVQMRVLLAKTRLDNLGTKEGLNLLVKTTIQKVIVLIRLPKAVIGNTGNLVSLMNVRNRMIRYLEIDVVPKKESLEVGRIQSKGSGNR
ncbi:hypothetical protein Zmor_015096 [Zophobas morio]|uniref:Uncharacterized protein n=1 Tax=Zophobas morio TaxID=2755281 RepID=A0AA38IKN7_9CUCU|nr:hypothetical protein Zmor_015096 [Zophobas morio]